jgi:YhgE/Pip-like protein
MDVPADPASIVVGVMTAFYMASVVDPLAHLRGLPVAVVNQDRGVMTGAQRLDLGQEVQAGLLASPAVSGRLRLEVLTLPAAERVMDRDGTYATVVIPSDFSAALLTEAGLHVAGTTPGRSQIEILTSQQRPGDGPDTVMASRLELRRLRNADWRTPTPSTAPANRPGGQAERERRTAWQHSATGEPRPW